MKTGDTTATCHCAAPSRQEAPPGAWEAGAGVYVTAGAKVNYKMLQRAVCWDPCLNNDGNTVGGSVVGTWDNDRHRQGLLHHPPCHLVTEKSRQETGELSTWYLLSWVEISLLIPVCIFPNSKQR